MTTNTLSYPVILFSKQESETFDLRESEDALLSTTPLTLQKNIHINSIIVDMSGCQYDIAGVERSYKGKLQEHFDNLLNRPIKVQILLRDDCVQMDLTEFCARIRAAFRDNVFADVWAEAGIDRDALDAFLENAASISEVIKHFDQISAWSSPLA
jgi:hypothetical protein